MLCQKNRKLIWLPGRKELKNPIGEGEISSGPEVVGQDWQSWGTA